MNAQEIYQQIGELMWSLMKNEANQIKCRFMLYDYCQSFAIDWLDNQGVEKGFWIDFDDPNPIDEVENKLRDLIECLQNLYKPNTDCFNQGIITLNREMVLNMSFANIPDDDMDMSLYLRGISELSKKEIEEYYISVEDWQASIRKYKDNPVIERFNTEPNIQLNADKKGNFINNVVYPKEIDIDESQNPHDILNKVMQLLFPENAECLCYKVYYLGNASAFQFYYQTKTGETIFLQEEKMLNGYNQSKALKFIDNALNVIRQQDQENSDIWNEVVILVEKNGAISLNKSFNIENMGDVDIEAGFGELDPEIKGFFKRFGFI